MFPIVSLLMHETRTHQQNGTGHDYEPTRKLYETRTRLRTHTHQTAQIRAARAKVPSSSKTFSQQSQHTADPEITRLARANTPGGGTHETNTRDSAQKSTDKEKKEMQPL